MEFESAKKTAERLGVNIRTVQKWAKENKFGGACRLGREWLIPKDALPLKTEETKVRHHLMPVLSNNYVPGYCKNMIENLEDETDRRIAAAEYNYYKGKTREAIEIA